MNKDDWITQRLYANTVQLKSGMSVETLKKCQVIYNSVTQMCQLEEQDKNRLVGKSVRPTVFRQPLTTDTDSAKAIKNATGVFITADMQPYPVIENIQFRLFQIVN